MPPFSVISPGVLYCYSGGGFSRAARVCLIRDPLPTRPLPRHPVSPIARQVEYLLVLATPVMVRLFGLEFKAPADLESNPQYQNKHGAEMTIALDTMRETPSDNVLMQSIVGTPLGRIFMGGSDGNIYELFYQQDQPGILDLGSILTLGHVLVCSTLSRTSLHTQRAM